MATAYIIEINGIPGYPRMQIAEYPAEANQKVTFTSSSVQSAAFSSRTRIATIFCEDACFYEVGENPTATTNSSYLPAGRDRDIGVKPGQKIAFIAAS